MNKLENIVKIEWVKDKELGDGFKLFDELGNWAAKPADAILTKDVKTLSKEEIELWIKENFKLEKTKNQFIGGKFSCNVIKIKE